MLLIHILCKQIISNVYNLSFFSFFYKVFFLSLDDQVKKIPTW